jgi:hypothetical protein
MSRTAKILLAILLAGVLLIGSAAILLWRYVDGHKAGWLQAGQTALQDGAREGAAMDDAGCVDAGFARLRNDDSLGGLKSRLWLKGCLGASQPKDGTCADVPRVGDVLDSVRWISAHCAARGLNNDRGCQGQAQELQQHCMDVAGAWGKPRAPGGQPSDASHSSSEPSLTPSNRIVDR